MLYAMGNLATADYIQENEPLSHASRCVTKEAVYQSTPFPQKMQEDKLGL